MKGKRFLALIMMMLVLVPSAQAEKVEVPANINGLLSNCRFEDAYALVEDDYSLKEYVFAVNYAAFALYQKMTWFEKYQDVIINYFIHDSGSIIILNVTITDIFRGPNDVFMAFYVDNKKQICEYITLFLTVEEFEQQWKDIRAEVEEEQKKYETDDEKTMVWDTPKYWAWFNLYVFMDSLRPILLYRYVDGAILRAIYPKLNAPPALLRREE